ncbi:MAG: glycosyltransferase family 2 protein [Bacteroidales bacterium]|nr:glycosyltransferase family 2 protein [Bacteroidales bacterium]
MELLKRAVQSVLSQTYSNYELVIVDDASDDSTPNWCLQLESTYPSKIKYIRIDKNDSKGGNYARNLGIKNSLGEYLAFLDDDDEWLPSKLEKQVAVMDEKKNCVLVYGDRLIENVNSRGEISYTHLSFNKKYSGDVSKDILTDIFTTTSLILTRKSAVEEAGLFDEDLKFWQEYELSIRLAQIGEFLYVDEPLIRYRVNTFDTSRLTNKYHEWRKAVKYVRSKHRTLYNSLSSYDKFKSIALIWEDASHRTRTCNLPVKSFVYKYLYKSYRIIDAIHNGTFMKKLKTRFHVLPQFNKEK